MRQIGRLFIAFFRQVFAAAMLLCLTAPIATAAQPILVLEAQDGSTWNLSLDDLDALPQITIRTTTPWHEGEQVFAGPSLLSVLNKHGIDTRMVLAEALNDYQALIPTSELTPTQPILATRHNGKTMSVREKGPIFIIYPYSSLGNLEARILSQSVWQLIRLRATSGILE